MCSDVIGSFNATPKQTSVASIEALFIDNAEPPPPQPQQQQQRQQRQQMRC